MTNQRLFKRKKSSIPASIKIGGRRFDASIKDVSIQGALVLTGEPLETGTRLSIRSDYMSFDGPFQIDAEVVSCRADGIGVKFDSVSDNQKSWIGFLFR
jgi:PilZ domain